MKEPSLRASRLALAGGLTAVLLVGGGGFLLGRSTSERQTVAVSPTPIVAPAPEPSSASTDASHRMLGRVDLIALAEAAADAVAAGSAAPAEVVKAEGRRFELRLPFGCAGPTTEGSEASMRWRYDDGEKALRVHVAPVAWTASDWSPATAPLDAEAIEGFWITRPWTSSETCPPIVDQSAVAGTEPVTLPGQTLAIAQFFKGKGSRQGRRDGQPFEMAAKVARDTMNVSRGLSLRLSGRIASVPGNGPTLCRQPAGPEQRPICVTAITLGEVAIENNATSETLAIWNISRGDDTE